VGELKPMLELNTKEGMMTAANTNQEMMERCIDQCFDVVHQASHCVDWCIKSDQATTLAECTRLCLDSASLTGACAEMMARNSRFSAQVCGICADVCDACAAECEKHQDMGDIMRQCAEACRRCAETCRQMAA
jgi:hypothetical protein